MARLSPGVSFLLRTSRTFVLLSAFVFALLTWQSYLRISGAVALALALASAPLLVAARIHLRYRHIRAAAARSHSILPPKWHGRLPGDLDIMQDMVNSLKFGYPGMSVFAW